MLGQAYSLENRKYNVIILAGGAGSRMGEASDYIPKALTKLGNQRAIDYIINRYLMVAEKFIIGVGYHWDILEKYILGSYPKMNFSFSKENVQDIKNNAISALFCLDNADSRYGTIITFCDLLMLSDFRIYGDTVYVATENTVGNVGTFRHSLESLSFFSGVVVNDPPRSISEISNGILGTFIFENTVKLKEIVYSKGFQLQDLTLDVVKEYFKDTIKVSIVTAQKVFEFGNQEDLKKVRTLWES